MSLHIGGTPTHQTIQCHDTKHYSLKKQQLRNNVGVYCSMLQESGMHFECIVHFPKQKNPLLHDIWALPPGSTTGSRSAKDSI
jgi:hypothetical protein